MTRVQKGVKYYGNVFTIRAIEDCIRATRKYSEGIRTKRKHHPHSEIQGEDFPTPVFIKYYEVYPDMEIGWDMQVSDFLDWLWQDTLCIDIWFHYDYRCNKGSIEIRDGQEAVKKLEDTIPSFKKSIQVVNGKDNKTK